MKEYKLIFKFSTNPDILLREEITKKIKEFHEKSLVVFGNEFEIIVLSEEKWEE